MSDRLIIERTRQIDQIGIASIPVDKPDAQPNQTGRQESEIGPLNRRETIQKRNRLDDDAHTGDAGRRREKRLRDVRHLDLARGKESLESTAAHVLERFQRERRREFQSNGDDDALVYVARRVRVALRLARDLRSQGVERSR